jgi:hypothetical protein
MLVIQKIYYHVASVPRTLCSCQQNVARSVTTRRAADQWITEGHLYNKIKFTIGK